MTKSLHLVSGPISGEFVIREISGLQVKTEAGALAVFLGQVRKDEVNGKQVSGIDYSAYDDMIDPVVQAIKDQIFEKFPDLICLQIQHSTGLVQCGETSLLVVVSCGHRKQSFAALESCVELIKQKLPVWKKELFSDGTSRWI